jgi:hypothetical protein
MRAFDSVGSGRLRGCLAGLRTGPYEKVIGAHSQRLYVSLYRTPRIPMGIRREPFEIYRNGRSPQCEPSTGSRDHY